MGTNTPGGRMRVRPLVLTVALIISAGLVTPVNATDRVEEQWTLPLEGNSGQELTGLLIQDDSVLPVSVLLGNIKEGGQGQLDVKVCADLNDAYCSGSTASRFDAALNPCSSPAELNCIEGITATGESGIETVGVYSGQRIPSRGRTRFPASAQHNLPAGGEPSSWSFAGLTHGGGTNTYLATAFLRGFRPAGSEKFSFTSYSLRLSPYILTTGNYEMPYYRDDDDKDTAGCVEKQLACGLDLVGKAPTECASVDDGSCALRHAFPAGYRFRFTLRLTQSPTGWFHGRVQQPDVQITQIPSGYRVTIEGTPVTVPTVGALRPYASLTVDEREGTAVDGGFSWGEQGPTGRRNVIYKPSPDSSKALSLYNLWQPYLKDTASASPTVWTVRTLSTGGDAASCFRQTDRFVGMVTTNAMIYAPGPPRFDELAQSLDYTVASPHLKSDGSVFKGTYDLQIRSDVARCVYNFSSAPISATVSVINAGGDQTVATTVASEKDGWLRLAAYGFTFSNPTVRVKLAQPTPTPTATPSTSPKPVSATKKTISCVKGTKTTKVSGTAPRCPAGWKRR